MYPLFPVELLYSEGHSSNNCIDLLQFAWVTHEKLIFLKDSILSTLYIYVRGISPAVYKTFKEQTRLFLYRHLFIFFLWIDP